MVGQYGGPVQGVAAQGRYVYAGVGPRLVVLDALDPANMHPVGATAQFDDFVKGVAISGTLAYVAAGSAGLRVINVSDPAHPAEISAWDSPGYAQGVAVDGQTAYLADGPYGLAAVDVTNPAQPVALGSAYATNFAFGVAVSGHYVYIAAGSAGLMVANVTDPAHPVEIGRVNTPGYAYGVAAAGAYAYIADGWNGLQIVNVADPSHPTLSGLLSTPGWAFGVALAGTRAYVADAAGGLRIVNVANPAVPVALGAYEPGPGHIGSVAIIGNIAFLANRGKGVHAVNISDPAHPASIALYSPLSDAVRVVVAGNYAYIAAGTNGLRIVDVADVTHPTEVGWYETQGYAVGIQVSGNYAYVAVMPGQSGRGMHVVNVSNPANPTLAAFYPDPSSDGAYRDIAVAGGVAYLPDETGLQLVSVANPLQPTHLSRIELMEGEGQEATGVAVSGSVAYVASSFAGLKTVDVTNPLTPTLLGQSTTEWSSSQDVVVVGNIAYMAEYNILRSVDVSDPAHPVDLGLVFTPGQAYELAVAGNTAYVADSGQGLTTVDVSDPANPALTGGFDTVGYTRGVDVAGGYIYLADGPAGLVILAPSAGGMFAAESRNSFLKTPPVASSSADFVPGMALRPIDLPDDSRMAPEDLTLEADGYAGAAAATTCTVSSAADSGTGTLHACLQTAQSGTTINFSPAAFPPAHPVTITLLTPLPHFYGNVTLDASNAGVILDGSSLGEGNWGLALTSDGNIVRGLQLTGFPGAAILVMGKNNVIGGDRGQGTGPVGQGNLISGNRNFGIYIAESDASENLIVGNLIGTDVTGTQAWGNANIGVFLYGGPHDNTIGGTQAWQRNIVSDNYYAGIGMMEIGTNHNQVVGNYVGTDISGTIDLGNRGHGITMELAASANLIQGNLSSGNDRAGVCISDQGSNYNIVIGNRLGTDAGGTQPIPNDWVGVFAGFSGASFNRIGGTAPGEGNLISGNDIGVSVTGSNALGNLVLGNLIGTDSSGLNGLGNVQEGLNISAGETVAEGNVITANGMRGVFLGSGSTSSFLLGNIIGTDRSGAIALGNDGPGIEISASGINFVQANTVAFNLSHGVQVNEAQRNTLRRNSVYSNDGDGIVLTGTGNAQLAAPALASDPVTGISGTACVSCTVEIFADAGDEGRYYLATQVTDGTGGFAFGQLCPPAGLGFTATTTDHIGNTSEFSAPQDVLWTCSYIYLPLLLRRSP